MRPEVAKGYLEAARRIARHFTNGSIDTMGLDQDDYVGELAIHAFKAWRAHGYRCGFGSSSEQPYVKRAMWNRAKDLARTAQTRAVDAPFSLMGDPEDGIDTEARLEAREGLRILDGELGGWQRGLLAATGEGETGHQYALERGWHRSRITKARKRANRILSGAK